MKIFFLSSQIQGLRIVDTFPWLFLFSGKIKKKFTKIDLISSTTYFLFFIYSLFISNHNLSFLKISAFLLLFFLASRISLNRYTNINLNFYIFVLFGIILEEIMASYFGITSPIVRDVQGAFFFFREKSYFSLILFSLITFSREIKYSHIIFLFFIGIFTQSGVFWLLYFGLIFYKLIRNYSEHLINYLFVITTITLYGYLNIFVENFKSLFSLITYTDALRPLLNLTALNSNCIGTFFLEQCVQNKDFLNYSNLVEWDRITAQAPFFLLYSYFGIPGIFLSIFILVLMYQKIKNHNNSGFIFFNILLQMFIQGFLLSPLFLWVLALSKEKIKR